jgi:hypothetical protein
MKSFCVTLLALAASLTAQAGPRSAEIRAALQQASPSNSAPRRLSPEERAELRRQLSQLRSSSGKGS